MAASSIDRLPEELLLQIFDNLPSTQAPSEWKIREEPSLDLTRADTHPIKDVSLVSHKWRRIVQPMLFRYARIHFTVSPLLSEEWSQCAVCRTHLHLDADDPDRSTILNVEDPYHKQILVHIEREISRLGYEDGLKDTPITSNIYWAVGLHHGLDKFLQFIRDHGLHEAVYSIVLSTDSALLDASVDCESVCYYASAALFQQMHSIIMPSRIVIAAPPARLACLTNCLIDLSESWAFSDMQYQIVELRVDDPKNTAFINHQPEELMCHKSYSPASMADTSIIKLRPWTHLSINESSWLGAYATYEFFERGPPSLIHTIKNAIQNSIIRVQDAPESEGRKTLSSLRSFQYIAIFPFATHLDLRGMLEQIDELDVQLGPDPQAGILTLERIGKADLGDCWQELETAYRLIIWPFMTSRISREGLPKLKKFVCRDMRIPGIVRDLDDAFMPLCLPMWAEMEPGVFIRQSHQPPLEVDLFDV